jgi:plastocyanin
MRRILVVVGILGWSAIATAAEITGRVVMTPRGISLAQQSAANPYPGMLGSLPICGLPKSSADDAHDVVISLPEVTVSAAAVKSSSKADKAEIRQVHQSFLPRVLAIPVGTTVDFPNDDPIFHNAFSYSKSKRFDLGKYGKGKSASVTFEKPGIVQVFCDIHSSMSAYVWVAPTPFVTQPDASGEFVLRDVAPGTHVLEIWHPERGTQRRTVDVPATGVRIEIAL